MLEAVTAVAAIIIGAVVLVVIALVWESGVIQALFYLLFGLLLFGAMAYAIGNSILNAIFS